MKKIFYNKLIRDKIPDKIRSNGSDCEFFELSEKEYERELIKKVEEEASGMVSAKTKEELIAEIADVMDVLEEIFKFKKISKKEIEKWQEINFEKKGGFEKKLFLIWSSDDKYKSNEKKSKKIMR